MSCGVRGSDVQALPRQRPGRSNPTDFRNSAPRRRRQRRHYIWNDLGSQLDSHSVLIYKDKARTDGNRFVRRSTSVARTILNFPERLLHCESARRRPRSLI
jgi:hypothetical protein